MTLTDDDSKNMIQILIPSWALPVIGTLLLGVSTAGGTLLIKDNNKQIESMQKTSEKKEAEFQTAWDSHKLAEERFAFAEMFAGLIAQNTNDGVNRFIIPRSASYMRDAIYTMYLSHLDKGPSQQSESEIVEPNCDNSAEYPNLEKEVNKLKEKLEEGDLNAYDLLVSVLDKQRLLSACKLNEKRESIKKLEEDIRQIKVKSDSLQMLQIIFNFLGLIIVLLKDLPIWRN